MFGFIYLAAMPYLIAGALYLSLKTSIGMMSLIMAIASVCILCAVGTTVNVLFNLISLKKSVRSTAGKIFFVKIAYIPVYGALILLTLGMLNPWFLIAIWIPPAILISLAVFSGFTTIGAFVSMVRHRSCGIGLAFLLALMSFVPILDFIALLIMFIKGKKVSA